MATFKLDDVLNTDSSCLEKGFCKLRP